jgi:hypothetical protein
MPAQGERDVRQQPGQAGQRLAARPVRHQGHRDHQPDDQRIRHDPPSLPLLQAALLQRRVHDRLDQSVPEMPLQLAQPDQVRQPRIRQDRPVPPGHRRSRHHRAAEHRQLARRRHRASRRNRPATANQQVSGPHYDRSGGSPRIWVLRCPACISNVRQIRKHKGSWAGVD